MPLILLLVAAVLVPIGIVCGMLVWQWAFVDSYWGWITVGMLVFVTLTCIPDWIRQWKKKRRAALTASAAPQPPASSAR